VTVADPLLPPQVALTVVLDAVSAAGSVMVTVAEAEQLNASSTVTEYVPAIRSEAVAALPPDGDQL
jgi:hypothetical protein